MLNKLINYFKGYGPEGVYIRPLKNGKWRLLENGNEVVGNYTSYRGATRDAQRRGLTVKGV